MQRPSLFFTRITQLLLLCFISTEYLFAQQTSSSYIITKKAISTVDGLASREAFCAVQDKDGFMWFGTQNGLNRYDGKNFLLFTSQQGLRKNKVVQLVTDNANRLYIEYGLSVNGPFAGHSVDVMDLATHEVKKITDVLPGMPFKESDILWIFNDGSGEMAFLTSSPFRIWKYSPQKGFRLRCEINEPVNPLDTSISMRFTGQRVVAQNGNIVINFLHGRYYYITPDTVLKLNIPASYDALSVFKNNEVLFLCDTVGSRNPHAEKLQADGHMEEASLPAWHLDSAIRRSWRDVKSVVGKNGAIFCSPTEGMYLWDKQEFLELYPANELKGFVTVYNCLCDSHGNYWVCTSQGVIQVAIQKNHFRQYFTKDYHSDEFNNSTRGIFEDADGNIFANVYISLCSRGTNGEIKTVNSTGLAYALIKYKDDLLVSSDSIAWFDRKANRLNYRHLDKPSLYYGEIWSLLPLSDDKMLAGCTNNILIDDFKARKSAFVRYASPVIPPAKFVYRFLKTEDGNIWAVASTGLYVLNNEGLVIDYYGNAKDSLHHLPFSDIQDVYYAGNNIFWLATNGDGLFCWNRNNYALKQFTNADGLPSNVLYRIETDKYANLWISSDNGLARFNPQTLMCNRYTVKDGLSDNEFNRISSFKAPDGQLFFGGLNGVNAFYPEDFPADQDTFNAPLRVTSYNLFSGSQNKMLDNTDELLVKNKLILQPNDRFFILSFKLLDFTPSEEQRYAYRIDGIDNTWNYISDNSIRISGLAYGKYVLHIKGQNLHSNWSKSELTIPLIVLRPFYATNWFIALIIAACLLLVYVFYRWRTFRLRREKKFLEQTVTTRTAELREALAGKEMLLKEIHHRVKNNLQVISALLEMQGSRTYDEKTKAAIMDSQNRVLSIAFLHQNLYQQDDIKTVEVQSFVNELAQHISSVFSKEDCRVETLNNINGIFLDIDTAVPLGLIINELLTNSYKYAFSGKSEGTVKIDLKNNGNGSYTFSFSDNGVGLPTDFDIQKSNSLGMKLIRLLCKQLTGKLEYYNNNGSYFTFTLLDLEARSKMN